MAGILDNLDPQTQGLLQAAFAGLSASGPSRMPVGIGQIIGQAGSAGLTAADHAKKQQAALELQDVETKLKKVALVKSQLDADLQRQITAGGMGGLLNDPDMMEAVGTKLALAGHPGGAAFVNAAEKVRKQKAAAQQFQTMKSVEQTIQPDQQENAIAADQGTPEVPPVQTRRGGIFAGLQKSPFVSEEAGILQKALDSAPTADPEAWLKHYERLFSAHKTAQEKDIAAAEKYASLPKSTVIVQDRESSTGWSHQDTRTGEKTRGAPPPAGVAERVAPARPVITSTVSEDALTNDAWYQIINGKARPGSLPLGRDEGNRYREQLREKTAQIAKDIGLSPQQLATLGPENKSKFMALNAVEKDLAAIRPFDEMLNTNAKIAIDLGKKIAENRTNSQLLNKPITWLEQNATDNPDIAEYLFQIQTVKTEGARILNNPRLVGQLTDTARQEMAGVINGSMPLGQTTRVIERMISDGKNRVHAIENEADRLRTDIRGSATGRPAIPKNAPSPEQIQELMKKYGRKPG